MKEIKNAKIESTFLGIEDHGIFTYILHLDYGGSGQGFGTYGLDEYNEAKGRRIGTAYGTETIIRILAVLEKESWEELPGTVVRVESDSGKVYRIGHYLKDKWFDPKELLEIA